MEIKKNKSKIALMGFMGSGKSTLGKRLADQMQYEFIDLDNYIENKYKKSIEVIFKEDGEKYFREIEMQALQNFEDKKCFVLSLGGGTPCTAENLDFIQDNFFSIYLKPSLDVLLYRLQGSKKKRPLLKNLEGQELETWVRKTLKDREENYYHHADLVIHDMEMDSAIGEIIRNLYL